MTNKLNKIITLWSPVSGIGTTFTAINMAKSMGGKGAKVALFDFDLKTPATHIYLDNKDSIHCIDNIIPFTAGGVLQSGVLENNIQEVEGFSYLRGTNSPRQAQYITPESLASIVDTAMDMFDHIIIDTHSILDNAGTYVALKGADQIYLLTEKNAITIQQYNAVRNLISETFDTEKFRLIINKEQKNVYMTNEDVGNFYDIENSYELPLLDAEFINSINQGRWLSHLYSGKKAVKQYAKKMDQLILEGVGLNPSKQSKTKRSLLKR
jgi:Flp pilus assembly CpaE family ATPase